MPELSTPTRLAPKPSGFSVALHSARGRPQHLLFVEPDLNRAKSEAMGHYVALMSAARKFRELAQQAEEQAISLRESSNL